MEVNTEVVEKLAKAWLAEAKRLRLRGLCGCGEQVPIARARFKAGRDAKLLRNYKNQIREIVSSK